MEIKIYEEIGENEENLLTTFEVRKNLKTSTIIDKVKEKLKEVYNYEKDFTMLPTGNINLATGEANIKYVCFGIKRIIRIVY